MIASGIDAARRTAEGAFVALGTAPTREARALRKLLARHVVAVAALLTALARIVAVEAIVLSHIAVPPSAKLWCNAEAMPRAWRT
jgi:hypothetical protein